MLHFHLHLLWPAGHSQKTVHSSWRPLKGDYLFNQQALSLVFRGKFMEHMGRACQRENLKFAGDQYKKLKARLYEKNWIIDVRDPSMPAAATPTWTRRPAASSPQWRA
ncbi:MAG: transposase [Desulfobacterales bacterium]